MDAMRRGALKSRRCIRPERLDWSYKAVTAPRNGRYKSRAGLPLIQRSSKCRNVYLKIALLHNDIGPRASHELAFGDEFARTFDQRGQNLESATADMNGSFSHQ
jgi:hypothetical protein